MRLTKEIKYQFLKDAMAYIFKREVENINNTLQKMLTGVVEELKITDFYKKSVEVYKNYKNYTLPTEDICICLPNGFEEDGKSYDLNDMRSYYGWDKWSSYVGEYFHNSLEIERKDFKDYGLEDFCAAYFKNKMNQYEDYKLHTSMLIRFTDNPEDKYSYGCKVTKEEDGFKFGTVPLKDFNYSGFFTEEEYERLVNTYTKALTFYYENAKPLSLKMRDVIEKLKKIISVVDTTNGLFKILPNASKIMGLSINPNTKELEVDTELNELLN